MPSKLPTHKPPSLKQPEQRPDSGKRGYDAAWQRFRRWYASHHPAICTQCGHAGASREMHLDHIKPLAQGGEKYDESNLQWLCHDCHNRKTRQETAGGI